MEEISNFGFVRTAHILDDTFTEVEKWHALETILSSNLCALPIELLVVRAKLQDHGHRTVLQS